MQGKFTIPKLELNAFTLAARLTNWILNELQPSLDIQEVYVFVRNLSVEINNISNDIAEKKLNNLPYRYPRQPDLPKEPVVQSRSFQDVGLNYFGLLSIKAVLEGQKMLRCNNYVSWQISYQQRFLTCSADFSLEVECQKDSLTSDNAPSFKLGKAILYESMKSARSDPAVAKLLSAREIDWRHITPYAPWQGGFYESLIKSVKQSLYKTLAKAMLSLEEMTTVLVEIEGLINTRPLLHVSDLRPIDFIQKGSPNLFPTRGPM
ncbi:unnamed protein product [Heligmosomoides polygyrus]|uniref:Integrase catalytic domain-containing protein n=1 Tax=Heligmosomoides polygyrus TaxID=6339 RepID=A0A183GNJ9_HELPZ|nr:unnamed protein product [Heligmosomoides polygyrus]